MIKDEFTDQRLADRIVCKFESVFAYDEELLPRIWSSEDEVEVFFKKARSISFAELAAFKSSKVPGFIRKSLLEQAFPNDEVRLSKNIGPPFTVLGPRSAYLLTVVDRSRR